jgi:MscS family membrane protein
VADSVVDNFGAREFRRFKTVLGLTYDTTPKQMQAFVEGIRALLKANPVIRQEYYEVHFSSFGDSSLNVLVYAFFKTDSWTTELTEKHNILLDIMSLAQELGVSFAFPTQTLHLESVAAAEKRPAQSAHDDAELAATVEAFAPGGSKVAAERHKLTHGFWPEA